MKQYLDAVREVLTTGTRKENRTGVDTLSTFNVNYEIDLREGFPLLTTKKINWKNIVVENMWFLSGQPDISILQAHGCKFWDAWVEPSPFGGGRVPSAYGNFWRNFPIHDADDPQTNIVPGAFNDQIAWAVAELKRNPNSRRVVISAWAPGNAQTSRLPPCHIVFVLNVQNLKTRHAPACPSRFPGPDALGNRCNPCNCGAPEQPTTPHLCLHLTQRSCDIALGVPYNIAGYAFLLELFSRFTGIPAGIFAHTLVDAHAYTAKPDGSMAEYDHVPGLREQLTREPKPLPRLEIDEAVDSLDDLDWLLELPTAELMERFKLVGYDPHPAIPFRVAV